METHDARGVSGGEECGGCCTQKKQKHENVSKEKSSNLITKIEN